MKEFTSQTGGRFTYVDDFLNLQELALAIGEIFTDCDNFIVSGCEVSGNSISSGLVYLNGKLRIVEGVSSISGGWPQYIYEVNEHKNVPYASGGEKVGREVWGARIGKNVPTTNTPLTNAVPKAITINSTGGLRMKDAWFGKYALLLNPAASSQTVQKTVNFNTLNVSGVFTGRGQNKLVAPNGAIGTWFYSGNSMIFENYVSGKRLQMIMSDSNDIRFMVSGTQIASIGASSVSFSKPVTTSQLNIGNLRVIANRIYDSGTANNSGEVNINMVGYGGATTYYRTTRIGNGKNSTMMEISGQLNNITCFAPVIINTSTAFPIRLKATVPKSSISLENYIAWQDSNSASIAHLGFYSTTSNEYLLHNLIGNVKITGSSCVDLGPAIKEGGILLEEKYALITTMNNELKKKANSADVYTTSQLYTRLQCDAKYATKDGAFSQFITQTIPASTLRSQIGAVGSDDIAVFAKKDQYLADMATSETVKAKIRENIGAAAKEETQKDTGWVNISGTSLYARQIGNIVSIQGTVTTKHSGNVFSLPNNIDSPRYAVKHTIGFANNRTWVCKIAGGGRACTVVYCDSSCNRSTEFSITYMT